MSERFTNFNECTVERIHFFITYQKHKAVLLLTDSSKPTAVRMSACIVIENFWSALGKCDELLPCMWLLYERFLNHNVPSECMSDRFLSDLPIGSALDGTMNLRNSPEIALLRDHVFKVAKIIKNNKNRKL